MNILKHVPSGESFQIRFEYSQMYKAPSVPAAIPPGAPFEVSKKAPFPITVVTSPEHNKLAIFLLWLQRHIPSDEILRTVQPNALSSV